MKLTSYTISQMQKEIESFLFIKWLDSSLNDWEDPDLRELWLLYHDIMKRQIRVVDND